MAVLRAVVEIGLEANPDAPWPVEPVGEFRSEVLDSGTSAAVIGSVMAAAADWCRPEETDDGHMPTPAEALRWIADADYQVISGGVQASDDRATVDPGCCCELNDWRGWADPERRSAMWLGHSPEPWIERTDTGLTVHQDRDDPQRIPVIIAADEVPRLVAELRADLLGFLEAVERWATDVTGDPQLAAEVVAAIDRHVGISAPLPATPAPPAPPTP